MGSEGGDPWAAFSKGVVTQLFYNALHSCSHYPAPKNTSSPETKHSEHESPFQFEWREWKGKVFVPFAAGFRQHVHRNRSGFPVFSQHTPVYVSTVICSFISGTLSWKQGGCSGERKGCAAVDVLCERGRRREGEKEKKEGEKELRGVWGAGVMTLHAFVFGVAAVLGPSTGCHLAARQISLLVLLLLLLLLALSVRLLRS